LIILLHFVIILFIYLFIFSSKLDEIVDNGRINDSPKTPNSPNKRKFSFKFSTSKSSPKSERRNFSEETESIGDIIESITPAAKEAYITLVDKGSSLVDKLSLDSTSPITNSSDADDPTDGNPLRMLRSAGIGGVLRAKVRGNRSFSQPRLPTTAQTAGLARVASTRSNLGNALIQFQTLKQLFNNIAKV